MITPPNFGSGGGSCLPSMVVVALGEPGVPVVCWAAAGRQVVASSVAAENASVVVFMAGPSSRKCVYGRDPDPGCILVRSS